jgi:hypothetical protein
LPASEQALAPVWTDAQIEAERKAYAQMKKSTAAADSAPAKEMFKGTDFEEAAQPINRDSVVVDSADAAAGTSSNESVPGSAGADSKRETSSAEGEKRPMSNSNSLAVKSFVSGFSVKADSTFEEAGLHRPCTSPFPSVAFPDTGQSRYSRIARKSRASSPCTSPRTRTAA